MASPQLDDERIFHTARLLPSGPARAEYLDHVCAGNQALRERVEALLDVHEKEQSFLKSSGDQHDATIDLTAGTEKTGETIGPYKLLQQIGEGGMGVVYMAEQIDPIERRVALKIIKPGMDTRQVIARFEAERQALAMMDHPNIAKVLDAGVTGTGQPYFVMELVKGIPITEYCDQHHLTPRERLELFVLVCQAIQHAHQKGIIHRDVKPSNVLVTRYDDHPVPKVIDFGVAKAMDHRLTEKTMFTEFGQVLGTFEYMSPEQAQLNQWDVDTRTDIYSLGVLLYELLSGETPFDRQRLRSAAIDELLRIIRDEEPPRPSTRVRTSQSLAAIAANRRTEPAKLSSVIRGELDWIVMQALEKDRTRRYETASQFAEDVEHYLNNETVAACPPSAAYRLRKFTRRHWPVMATSSVVAAALLIGFGVATWQAIRESRQRDLAVIAQREAKQEAERADAEARKAQDEADRAKKAESDERKQNYRLTVDHAFRALADGDLDRLAKLLEQIRQNGGDVNSFEFRLLAEQLRRHDPEFVSPPGFKATCAQFTADSQHLVVGSTDATLYVFDVQTWEQVQRLQIQSTDDVAWETTTDIELLPNSKRFVVSGSLSNGRGALAIAESVDRDPTIIHELPAEVIDICVADSGVILSATREGSVRAWREQRERPLWEATFGEPIVGDYSESDNIAHQDISITTNGDLVVATPTHSPQELRVWDIETGDHVKTVKRTDNFRWTSFCRQSDRLALAGISGIQILRVENQELIPDRRIPGRTHRIAFSPDGSEVAAMDVYGGIRFCDLKTSQQTDRVVHKAGVGTVGFVDYSPNSERLVSVDAYGRLKVWNLEATRPVTQMCMTHSFAFHFVAVSPTSRYVAIWGEDRHTVRLWDLRTNSVTVLGDQPHVLGMDFSSDGKLLASGGRDGFVRVWDVAQPGIPKYEKQTELSAWAVGFLKGDDKRLAVAGAGGACLWDLNSNKLQRLFRCKPEEEYISLDSSSDGRFLVLGGGEWRFYESDEQGNTLLFDLQRSEGDEFVGKVPHDQMVYDVEFHPTRQEFAAGGLDAAVKLCTTIGGTPKIQGTIQDTTWRVTGLAYTPDGSRIATASPGQVTFFDATSHEQIGTFRFGEHFRRVAFLPDGTGMITASSEGYVRLWRAAPPKEVAN